MTFLFNNMNMYGMNGLFSGCGNPFSSFGGCFGGGFGGFSSIFNMIGGGFGGCYTPSITGRGIDNWGSVYNINGRCSGPSGGEVIGWALGTSIFGALAMFAGNAIQERQARKAQEAEEATIDDQIKEQLDILGVSSEKEAASVTGPEESYTKAVETANANITKVEGEVTTLKNKNIELNGQIGELDKAIESAQKDQTQTSISCGNLGTIDPGKDNATLIKTLQDKKAEIQAQISKNQEEIEKKEASIADDGKLGEKLKEANEAKSARAKEITDAQAELRSLQTQRQNEKDDVKLDAADGAKYGLFKNGRTSKAKLDEMVGDGNERDYSGCTVRDMHAAISAYRNATDKTQKEKYKKAFVDMYRAYVDKHGDAPNDSIRKAYELLK